MGTSHLIALLEKYRYQYSDKKAVIDQKQQLSYSSLFNNIDTLAAYLQQHNMQNEKIVFLLENSWELLCCYLACFKVGAICVPVKYSFKVSQIEYILDTSQAKWIITDQEKSSEISKFNNLEKIIVVGGNNTKHENFSAILKQNLLFKSVALDSNAYAVVFYTSGTTGEPKGVLHNHQALSYMLPVAARLANMADDSINLVSYSINQISGIAQQTLPMLIQGGTVILLEPFNVDQIINGLRKYKVTNLHLTPYMLGKLLDHPDFSPHLFSNLRCFVSGADKVPIELQKKFNKMTGKTITEAYGATETFACAANFERSLDKCGSLKPIDENIKLKVINASGREAQIDEIGELWVKSPGLMVGYWGNEKETKEKIRDGWFITGDLAKKDKDGFFSIMGRKKQIIIRRGSNISPLQVEAVFYQHPAIQAVGVVGVPCKGEGEVPRAFVSLKAGISKKPSAAELRDFVKEKLADYEVPDKIILLDEIPFNAAGKVDREKLKEKI